MTAATPLLDTHRQTGAALGEWFGWTMPSRFRDPTDEYRAVQNEVAVFDLSHRGQLEVTGREAPIFLHNLCTNDIQGLPLGGGCETFFCDRRARTLAHAMIYHLRLDGQRDALWVDTTPGRADFLKQHLDRHLISEQVEWADRTADFALLHLTGPRAEAVLAQLMDEPVPPLEIGQHMERMLGPNPAHIRRTDWLGRIGFDLMILSARALAVWTLLRGRGVSPAGLETFEILRIEAGTPVYGLDMDDSRFVVEVGRPHTICHTKGCYLGQEPIVMARDRAGFVNRTLMGLRLAEAPVPAGSKVSYGNDEIGVTTSSAVSPVRGAVALAYLKRGHQTPGTAVEVATEHGRQSAIITTLPFTDSA